MFWNVFLTASKIHFRMHIQKVELVKKFFTNLHLNRALYVKRDRTQKLLLIYQYSTFLPVDSHTFLESGKNSTEVKSFYYSNSSFQFANEFGRKQITYLPGRRMICFFLTKVILPIKVIGDGFWCLWLKNRTKRLSHLHCQANLLRHRYLDWHFPSCIHKALKKA